MDRGKLQRLSRRLPRYLKTKPIEALFLFIFLTFGIIYTVIIPPGWNTDESNHTYRISQLSVGNILSEKTIDPQTGLRAYGGDVPTGLLKLYERTGALEPGAPPNPEKKIDKHLYANRPDIIHIKDDGQRKPINFSGAALYSPISYAVYIPVFWLGKLFSLPFFWVIILSRLVGLLLTGLAFFFAIKYTPVGKWIFFAVGLIPTVVVQAATVGADAPQLAITVLFIAYIARRMFDSENPRLVQYGILAILGALLVLIKIAYAPIILLLLALPLIKKEYRNRKNIILTALTFIIAITPGLIWASLVSYIDINSNPKADFAAQKSFILSHPLTYLRTLYYTFFTITPMPPLVNMFGSFVWDSVALPAFYAYVASAALLSSLFVKSKREINLSPVFKQYYRLWRGTLLVVSLIMGVFIATALYIYSTPLRQSYIFSIQSRYFIPLLPLIMLAFYGTSVKNQRPVKIGIVIMSCLALIGATLAIYFRLYQTLIPGLS